MTLRENQNVLGKIQKITKIFCSIEKEVTKIDKDGNESVATISDKIKCIDSAIFMASSLSNLVDNLAEGIHKVKCKDFDYFLEYESVKDNLIKYKFLSSNKDYSNMLDENLKKPFKNTFQFLIMISMNLFCCYEKLFVLMSTQMIGKNLTKQHYLKKKNLIAT